MSATNSFLELLTLTVLMPTVVHPVAVMAGYDIVLHPTKLMCTSIPA